MNKVVALQNKMTRCPVFRVCVPTLFLKLAVFIEISKMVKYLSGEICLKSEISKISAYTYSTFEKLNKLRFFERSRRKKSNSTSLSKNSSLRETKQNKTKPTTTTTTKKHLAEK